MGVLMALAQQIGSYRQEMCFHSEGGTCTYDEWSTRVDIPEGIGEPVRHKEGEWWIRPGTLYCALCEEQMDDRIHDIDSLPNDTLTTGMRSRYVCRDCGEKGWVAVHVECTR